MEIKKRDVLELRRRMTRKDCTITRVCGCYVDGNRSVVLKFSRAFSDLEENEFFKYLEIAKKVLSGSLANNLLELRFRRGADAEERQRMLYAIKADKLKNPDLLDRLYEQIVETYDADGNYLILVFHDVYDVVAKTKDRKKLDESSETFEYMIAAVCPVDFSKPGLRYRETDNTIAVSDRFWMVGAPDVGFVYPAFANRSADSGAVMYYVKTGKDSHAEMIERILGCESCRTAGEEKDAFRAVIEDAFEDAQEGESVYLKVQNRLSQMTAPEPGEEEAPPLSLTAKVMSDVIDQVDLTEEAREIIQEAFDQEFGKLPPQAQNVVDRKLVKESAQRLRTLELETEVTDLRQELSHRDRQLTEAKKEVEAARAMPEPQNTGDVSISLRVTPQKARQIHAQMIGGIKYLVVPLEKGDAAQINGEPRDF